MLSNYNTICRTHEKQNFGVQDSEAILQSHIFHVKVRIRYNTSPKTLHTFLHLFCGPELHPEYLKNYPGSMSFS